MRLGPQKSLVCAISFWESLMIDKNWGTNCCNWQKIFWWQFFCLEKKLQIFLLKVIFIFIFIQYFYSVFWKCCLTALLCIPILLHSHQFDWVAKLLISSQYHLKHFIHFISRRMSLIDRIERIEQFWAFLNGYSE